MTKINIFPIPIWLCPPSTLAMKQLLCRYNVHMHCTEALSFPAADAVRGRCGEPEVCDEWRASEVCAHSVFFWQTHRAYLYQNPPIGAIANGFPAFPLGRARLPYKERNAQIRQRMTPGFFYKTWQYVCAGSVCTAEQHIKMTVGWKCSNVCSECALCLHFILELAR